MSEEMGMGRVRNICDDSRRGILSEPLPPLHLQELFFTLLQHWARLYGY